MSATRSQPSHDRPALPRGGGALKWLLIGVSVAFLGLALVIPLCAVFAEALRGGVRVYAAALRDPVAASAIRLTLLTTGIVLPVNVVFGLAAAWACARFRFPGRGTLLALIGLPLAVSPVVAGMVFLLLFGLQGWFGTWLAEHDIRIVFALPGIVLATSFVCVPFVAREVHALMEEQGSEEEQAALTLGASGWQMFTRITLPKIKWAVLYGAVLCNARAMGEFGAVSVVSGHIRGKTNTIPLHVEVLYNEYHLSAAFAVASLLTLLALVTLAAKAVLERVSRSGTVAVTEGET